MEILRPNSLFQRSIAMLLLLVVSLSLVYGSRSSATTSVTSYDYACGTSIAPDQPAANTELISSYRAWKNIYVTASGAGGFLRVQRPGDSNDTVSEGIGYGMLLAAYMEDRATFDGLWNYAKSHFDTNGLMHWHISASNVVIGENAATDGDEDMAAALIVADKTWGGYYTEATSLINNIKQHEVEVNTHVIKPGAVWGGSDITNPSYFAPAYYKVFKAYTNDTSWDAVVDTAYQIIANVNAKTDAATTGLQPDWTTATGDPVSGMSYDYTYGATRVPWRLAKDAAWFCDSRAISQLARINSFFKNIGATAITDGYALDGTVIGQYHNAAFVGPAASAAIISSDAAYKTAIWNETVSLTNGGDYNDSLRLLSLLLISGNMPNPLTIENNTPTPTPTVESPTFIPVPASQPAYLPLVVKPFPREWQDDFNDGQLDTRWWKVSSDSSVIYEEKGVLNLRVTPEQSQDKSIYAEISSTTADHLIEEISFTTVLQSFNGPAAGGAGISVNTTNGPFIQTSIGPGTSGPWLDLSVCRQASCSSYDDFAHPPGRTIQANVPINVRLLRTSDRIELYVNGEPVIQEVTTKQIMSFHFSIYAPQTKAFHVTIDDVNVIYADE